RLQRTSPGARLLPPVAPAAAPASR
ncbi:MAG: hypothetical protein JWN17_3145, partial [Frankiales bacterium]|nr:hypothetical protein [Frankiales bacterium]